MQPNASGQQAAPIDDASYSTWLSQFVAADPAYQAYCEQTIRDNVRMKNQGSQHSQDMFLFQNIFRDWPLQQKKGFYVESGANDALTLSTSLFFDKCLGWQGLCIEPQPEYHKALKEKRSCILVPECVSSKKETVQMTVSDVMSAVTDKGDIAVQCAPIDDILARYTNGTQKQIDLWILDVEGYELKVLEGIDFTKTPVDVMLIESMWLPPAPRRLDILMGERGFMKYHELAIDSVFVRRGSPPALRELESTRPFWYPPQHMSDLQNTADWMKLPNTQIMLKKAWGLAARK